jgi:hypothetical protein
VNEPLRFGVFITPFHALGQSPTVATEYDVDDVFMGLGFSAEVIAGSTT